MAQTLAPRMVSDFDMIPGHYVSSSAAEKSRYQRWQGLQAKGQIRERGAEMELLFQVLQLSVKGGDFILIHSSFRVKDRGARGRYYLPVTPCPQATCSTCPGQEIIRSGQNR